jgi:hypothetical protein
MAGSLDLGGGGATLGGPASPVFTFRYTEDGLVPLYNVVCTGVVEHGGPAPPTATFKYLFDDAYRASLGWPGRIEDVWPIDATGPYVVQSDDRIVCCRANPDQTYDFLFDGFAQIPQADVSPSGEHATFAAVGVAIREFDNPIPGRTQRDGDPSGILDSTGGADVHTDLPTRFNPADKSYGDDGGYRPNKTPDDYDTDNGGSPIHPVFVEPGIRGRDEASEAPAYWSIPDAIRYILAECNPESEWTSYPALSTLDDLFAAVYTDDDAGSFSLGDIHRDPLLIRDFDASNRPWPEAVAELLSYAGFAMRWDLEAGTSGLPTTYLRFFRKDMLATSPTKRLYLDRPGASLAAGSRNNVVQLHLARDANAIVNAWQVETAQRTVEVSVVLAPLYQPAATDADASADESSGRGKYTKAALDNADATGDDRRKYRWYGADELGEGHWDGDASEWREGSPFDFSEVFPPDDDGDETYCFRYRPGLGGLIATDSRKVALKARLDIAFDVEAGPRLDDPTDGTRWYPVPKGWRLLKDRLGIEVDVNDVEEHWASGNRGIPGGGNLRGVTWWAAPPAKVGDADTGGKPPALRLTVAIEDDLRMPISAGKRVGSPTQYARWRVADARDHFQYTSVHPSSCNFASMGGTGSDPVVVRDDTDAADNHARALRSAHEMPPLAGSVTLPGVVRQYEVGDRVTLISGRDINLGQSAASASGETTTFPVVVSRSYSLDGHFYTTLSLSDLRAERRHNAF